MEITDKKCKNICSTSKDMSLEIKMVMRRFFID